jgi:hypothetical protein
MRKYMSEIEDDVPARQDKSYKITKGLNKTEKDKVCLNFITNGVWKQFYEILWTNKEMLYLANNNKNIDPI